MNLNVKEDLIGKILYVFAFVFLAFTFYVAIRYPFMTIDEWFTKGLVSLPMAQQIAITSIDVHPPLYYLLCTAVVSLVDMLHLNIDKVITLTVMSVIPAAAIFAVSLTKIRTNYGNLTGGLFAFSLLTMSSFFTQYLTIRMYSWGMLFIVLGFLCVKPILEKNDIKHWIVLSVIAALGAYTHYFIAIAFVSLYIVLFAFAFFKYRDFLRNWLISTVVGIIIYVPWLFSLFAQLGEVQQSYWIPPINIYTALNCFTCYMTLYWNEILFYASFILVIVFAALVVVNYVKNQDIDNEFLLIGILTYVLANLIGIILSLVFKPILIVRYVIPVSSIVWILISIYIGKMDLKKLAIVLALVILLAGTMNVSSQMSDVYTYHDQTEYAQNFLYKIDNDNSVVIFDGMQKYVRFCDDLANAQTFVKYELNNVTQEPEYISLLGLDTTEFKIPYDVNSHPDKDIYFVRDFRIEMDPVTGYDYSDVLSIENVNVTQIVKSG